MTKPDKEKEQMESVPNQVYNQFIKELGKNKIDSEVIARLKEILINKNDTSNSAVEEALFPNDK